MPVEQKIKERAYIIDPECWISYTGMDAVHKAAMDTRRCAALEKAASELGKTLPETYMIHEIINDHILPDDEIAVITTAQKIPSGSTVTKRSGEQRYVLTRNLTIYATRGTHTISGYFLVGTRGEINQVEAGKRLAWLVSADNFVHALRDSWDRENK